MEVNLEGNKLVINLDELEARIARKTMHILAPMFSLTARIYLRMIFLLLQTDRQRFKEIRQRIEAGDDPHQVLGPLMSELGDHIRKNPDILNELAAGPSFDELEKLLPEDDERHNQST